MVRRRYVVAAAAVAALAPLGLALPASAATHTPITHHHHHGSGSYGLDQLLGTVTGALDGGSSDSNPVTGGGTQSGEGSLSASPDTVTENDSGNVSFAVEGSGLTPLMHVTFHSPGLDAACTGGNTLGGQTATADYNGKPQPGRQRVGVRTGQLHDRGIGAVHALPDLHHHDHHRRTVVTPP